MPWRRSSKHDGCENGFHSCFGCSGDTNFATRAKSKRSSSRRCVHVASLAPACTLFVLGMTPATAWFHAPPTATSTVGPAASRKSWTMGHSSRLFPQQPQRLETGDRDRGVLMFGGNTMAVNRAHENEEPLWLGLDLSTQSLTAAVLRGDGVGGDFNEPVVLESINYEVRTVSRSLKPRTGVHLHFEAQNTTTALSYVDIYFYVSQPFSSQRQNNRSQSLLSSCGVHTSPSSCSLVYSVYVPVGVKRRSS